MKGKVEPKRRANFLEAYAKLGSITAAAREANVHRTSHYNWLADPAYAKEFEFANEAFNDKLRAEIRRRAVEGVLKPVWYKGHRVGAVREYSDTLLIFEAKSRMPRHAELTST